MAAATSRNAVEVVVTVPEPFGAEVLAQSGFRSTLGVLTELFASAREHVVIAAPFVQGAEGLQAGALGLALLAALRRGVRVDLISTRTSLARLDLTKLRELAGPRIRTLCPRGNLEDPRILGSHAKFCLCDGEHAYIGSANITQRGIFGHFELGVLLHGKRAEEVSGFVRGLEESGYLLEVVQ